MEDLGATGSPVLQRSMTERHNLSPTQDPLQSKLQQQQPSKQQPLLLQGAFRGLFFFNHGLDGLSTKKKGLAAFSCCMGPFQTNRAREWRLREYGTEGRSWSLVLNEEKEEQQRQQKVARKLRRILCRDSAAAMDLFLERRGFSRLLSFFSFSLSRDFSSSSSFLRIQQDFLSSSQVCIVCIAAQDAAPLLLLLSSLNEDQFQSPSRFFMHQQLRLHAGDVLI